MNGCSVTGTVIPRLGNPAGRMLETAGSANWWFHSEADEQPHGWTSRKRPIPVLLTPCIEGPLLVREADILLEDRWSAVNAERRRQEHAQINVRY